jgi:hypothetical protein
MNNQKFAKIKKKAFFFKLILIHKIHLLQTMILATITKGSNRQESEAAQFRNFRKRRRLE